MAGYFHSNRRILRNGDFVEPGSYGSLVRQAGESGPHWFREKVLEEVRQARFPERLSSCFATDNIETASFYHRRHCPDGHLYTVAIDDPSLPIHVGDFNCVLPMPGRDETMERIAERYWTHDLHTAVDGHPGLVCDEIVTASRLRVLGPVLLAEHLSEYGLEGFMSLKPDGAAG